MAICLIIGATFGVAIFADILVRPRGLRSLAGIWLGFLPVLAMFGLMLALDGNMLAAALVAAGLAAGLGLISNAKRAVLGEALHFADMAMLTAVFRHPQFYLYALKRWQLAGLVLGGTLLLLALALAFDGRPARHLAGVLILLGSLAALAITLRLPPWRRLAPEADVDADVAAHGLIASMVLHWHRWRVSADPPPCLDALPSLTGTELIIAVQCESFADPAEIFDNPALAMPGLTAARRAAWAHGGLQVSCFGAYTMRAEYGLIFGRDEAALGFRRFNPYLTALGETSHALPARLAQIGWRSLFIHPHDLSFYGRDVVLPAAGFDELVGPEAFELPTQGRYVSDAAVAEAILARAQSATGPCYIHAVTIENHGPWPVDQAGEHCRLSSAYLQLVGRGDAMLTMLMTGVAALQRPAVLLFYGDHRPSIPGAVMPGGDRSTPYVLLRFSAEGKPMVGREALGDLTPADLHHALIAAITAPASTEAPSSDRAITTDMSCAIEQNDAG